VDFAPRVRPSRNKTGKNRKGFIRLGLLALLLFSCYKYYSNNQELPNTEITQVPKVKIPFQPGFYSNFRHYPQDDTISFSGKSFIVQDSCDSLLTERTHLYLKRHKPEVAAIIVADLHSGSIISLSEKSHDTLFAQPNLVFGNKFPAASLAKIVTALSAIDGKGMYSGSSLIQIGAYHTLYKRQLRARAGIKYVNINLKKAFGYSINPAFGMLGQGIGPEILRLYGRKLGFNSASSPPRLVPSHLTVPDSGYNLAEFSCGFNQNTTISPIHALELASLIGGNGHYVPSRFAEALIPLDTHNILYENGPPARSLKLSSKSLESMQELMEATVNNGTARKSFHKIMKNHHLALLDIGGKTGSLDGTSPKGRYDWFMGYARLKSDPSKGIALVVMQVHQTYQSLRSSSIAALIIKDWLSSQKHKPQTVS
jgi:peptidoglycan glycosyltransferase